MAHLVNDAILDWARRRPDAPALRHAGADTSYAALAAAVAAAGAGLRALGAARHDRVAVCLPKGLPAVAALFGAVAAGCAAVPLDPRLGPRQFAALLRDSGARILVAPAARLEALAASAAPCPQLRVALACGVPAAAPAGVTVVDLTACTGAGRGALGGALGGGVDGDMAALLYLPAASGKPKGLALSHRNLVAAADSAVRYLGIDARDRLLAALPLSLDYGLNQLTSSFAAGACATLLEPHDAREIVEAVQAGEITGLAALPPMWEELARLDWPGAGATLRYVTCAGGPLPRATLDALRRALPRTRIHLMYGLPEAFRSTCLAPEQLARHPESVGTPAPHAELLVLRPDGRECAPGETGELVQRGPLVALGYWNDPHKCAQAFRPLPPRAGLAQGETALWSGQAARRDEDGYVYVLGGGDDSIRTRGHRVSPGEVEEVVYGTGLVEEAAAVGVAHPVMGQVIAVLATPRRGCTLDSALLFGACRERLPGYMLPAMVDVRRAPLPRAANGKIDRALLAGELAPLFAEAMP